MASTGALAVALTPKGILTVANSAKSPILKQLGALSIPNPSKINTIVSGFGSSTSVDINITEGKFNPTNLSLSNLQQSAGGTFTVDAVLTGTLDFSKWHENDTTTSSSGQPNHSSFTSTFRITFEYVKLSITVAIMLDSTNKLVPKVGSTTLTDKKFTFQLPNQTSLTSSSFKCVTDKIDGEISDKFGSMTDAIATSINIGLESVFSVIPNSGKLTSDIIYIFPGTPNGLEFPNNNGVQYRVLGKLQWKGQDAPGDIGNVPFPPIPTVADKHDGLFYVSNYSFNALFWAFYKQGVLNFSFNKTNVPFQPALNTNYYMDTPIYQKYPNRDMIIDLVLKTAPTTLLKANEADLTYDATLTFFVAKVGSSTEKDAKLFSVNLMEIDALEFFSVSTNRNYLQLVTFHVSTVKQLSIEVTQSNIPGNITPTLEMIWKFVLHSVYADILDTAAQTGVPLLSSLEGVFTNYAINLQPGYVSVAVNFTPKVKYASVMQNGHDVTISSLSVPHSNLAIM